MSEINKESLVANQGKASKLNEVKEAAQAMSAKYEDGILVLNEPIKVGDKEITEIAFNFRKLRGRDLVEAMDCDSRAGMRTTSKQAFALFCRACRGVGMPDEHDLNDRMSVADAMNAVKVTQLFLASKALETNDSIKSL